MRVVGEEKTIECMHVMQSQEKECGIKYFILLSFSRNWEKTLEYCIALRFLVTDVVERA